MMHNPISMQLPLGSRRRYSARRTAQILPILEKNLGLIEGTEEEEKREMVEFACNLSLGDLEQYE
jgi:hypothetical protein